MTSASSNARSALQTSLIGINNRNLKTLKTDLATTEQLAPLVPPDRFLIAESGIRTHADLRRLAAAGAHCFLVGESLMRQPDVDRGYARIAGRQPRGSMSERLHPFRRARATPAMVDVGAKPVTERTATARARVVMQPATAALIRSGGSEERRRAGRRAHCRHHGGQAHADLIPLCHPLPISAVSLDLDAAEPSAVEIAATVRTTGQTGVEMEALTAASVAALTVYDMCKSVDRGMRIEALRLTHKAGGKSGEFTQD